MNVIHYLFGVVQFVFSNYEKEKLSSKLGIRRNEVRRTE